MRLNGFMGKNLRVALFLQLAFLTPAFFGAENAPPEHSYQVILIADATLKMGEQTQKVNSDTRVSYTHKSTGSKVEVTCDAMDLSVKQDEKEVMKMKADKSSVIITTWNTPPVEFTATGGTDEQKQQLHDEFGQPLVTLELDADGAETKRTPSSAEGAKSLIESGAIQNMRMFHHPYFSDKNKWSAKTEISMGSGGCAGGELTFEKVSVDGNLQVVQVSGTLTNEKLERSKSMSIRNASYEVKGRQTYDTAAKKWDSGKWEVKAKCDMFHNEEAVGNLNGTMQIELKTMKK